MFTLAAETAAVRSKRSLPDDSASFSNVSKRIYPSKIVYRYIYERITLSFFLLHTFW